MLRVTAGIIEREGRVLVARRKRGRREELLWEFPGGQVEAGETPEECLKRELREELGIETRVGAFVGSSVFAYAWGDVTLLAYRVVVVAGEPRALADHEEVRWARIAELEAYDFAAADVPIARMVQSSATQP